MPESQSEGVDQQIQRLVDAACEIWIQRLIDKSRANPLLFYRDLKAGALDLEEQGLSGFPTLFWGLSGVFVNDLMGKALWSSWKTRSVFQGAVGAFCASTAPSASTGPICMRQDRRVLGLQSTRE